MTKAELVRSKKMEIVELFEVLVKDEFKDDLVALTECESAVLRAKISILGGEQPKRGWG